MDCRVEPGNDSWRDRGKLLLQSPPKRQKPSRFREGFFISIIVSRRISVFGRPGSDLLFQALRLSIIGAGEFNGRVRDGIGFRLPASTTRPAKDREAVNRIRPRLPYKLVFTSLHRSLRFRFQHDFVFDTISFLTMVFGIVRLRDAH